MSSPQHLTRRTALAGLGTGSLALALATMRGSASAHAPSPSLVDHPLTGLWLALLTLPTSPDVTVAVPSIYSPDGSVVLIYPVTEATQNGLRHKSAAVGTWEAVDEWTGHFTVVQVLSDTEGHYLGTLTLEGHPTVSQDRLTFQDEDPADRATIRDAANAIIAEIPGASPKPVLGYRMAPGNGGFPSSGAPRSTTNQHARGPHVTP